MATTYTSGSYPAAQNLNTVAVSNATLADFQQEVTDLLGGGFVIGGLTHDGTNFVAFMIEKRKWPGTA